jgi:NAD(P)-dependent dehydrogenase (short-subunit alcohol dehydrogenase family)
VTTGRAGDLAGKVAIVAGGSSGIGRASALRLCRDGAAVLVCSNDRSSLDAIREEARRDDLDLLAVHGDVRSSADVATVVGVAVEQRGGVDVLVNAAGVQRYGTVVETDESLWDEVLAVNLKGMYLTARHAIPLMRKRGGGSIVNVSSVQAIAMQRSVAAYAASKGGVNALTRSMAVDHAQENIRVNCVCPASVDTPMLRRSAQLFAGERTAEDMVAEWGSMHPIGRVARPEEIAEVVAFLAGPRSAFVTGAEIVVDGGMLAALGVRLPQRS